MAAPQDCAACLNLLFTGSNVFLPSHEICAALVVGRHGSAESRELPAALLADAACVRSYIESNALQAVDVEFTAGDELAFGAEPLRDIVRRTSKEKLEREGCSLVVVSN